MRVLNQVYLWFVLLLIVVNSLYLHGGYKSNISDNIFIAWLSVKRVNYHEYFISVYLVLILVKMNSVVIFSLLFFLNIFL